MRGAGVFLRQRMHQAMPERDNSQREFQEATGINVEEWETSERDSVAGTRSALPRTD